MKTTRSQRTALSLAITAAMTAMGPTAATAQTVISSDENVTQHWSAGDITINTGNLLARWRF